MKPIRSINKNNCTAVLSLESLEARMLLSVLIEDAESDGDAYQIKLTGPGGFTSSDLDNLITNSTSSGSSLMITLTEKGPQGDGRIHVGAIDTSSLNLGKIVIEGDLGALQIEKCNLLQVDSLGANDNDDKLYQFNQNVGKIIVNNGITDASIQINGDLSQLKVGKKDNSADNFTNTNLTVAGDLDNLQILQSITTASDIVVVGDLKKASVAKSIIFSDLAVGGDIKKLTVTGSIRQNCDISVSGNLESLAVGKNIDDLNLNVTGAVKNITVKNDCVDLSVNADSIEKFSVADDLNNTDFDVNANFKNFAAGDVDDLIIRVGGSLQKMQIARDFQNALVSVLNSIDSINIKQDLNRAAIMAGIDIGHDLILGTSDDGEWGNLEINSISVGGDMVDSSIAAGVKTSANSSDPWYGNGNDVRTYNDGTGTAHIKKITVKGEISTSFIPGESYAISADDGIDSVRAAGREFTGVTGVALQEF